jgi:hypothetical protein
MMHCGHEPTAVAQAFGTFGGFLKTAWLSLFGDRGPRELEPVAGVTSEFGRAGSGPAIVPLDISRIKPVPVREPESSREGASR